jgi:hypothetical protein
MLINYLGENPLVGVGAITVLGAIYYLLNRKPKLVRDAEAHFDALRKRRGDHYNRQRPLK